MRYTIDGIFVLVSILALLSPIAMDARHWFPSKRRAQAPRQMHESGE
jgi:hypothetical protein